MFSRINQGLPTRAFGTGRPDLVDRVSLPLWHGNTTVDVLTTIPGSALNGSECFPTGGGDPTLGYCGAVWTPDGKMWAGLGGGHGDSWKNQMNMIDLMADYVSWRLMIPSTAFENAPTNVAYYPDGKPASRHTYRSGAYDAVRNKIVWYGALYVWGGGSTFPDVASYDIATNTYDPAGTYPNGLTGGVIDQFGNLYNNGSTGASMLDIESLTNYQTATWISPLYGGQPYAHDTLRDQFFGFTLGGGENGSGLVSNVFRFVGGNRRQQTRTPITFSTTAAALAEWQAAGPTAAAMCYDKANDQFWWYDGSSSSKRGVFWIIKPNETNDWTLTKRVANVADVAIAQTMTSGLWTRMHWNEKLKGLIIQPDATNPLYFLRTAT